MVVGSPVVESSVESGGIGWVYSNVVVVCYVSASSDSGDTG